MSTRVDEIFEYNARIRNHSNAQSYNLRSNIICKLYSHSVKNIVLLFLFQACREEFSMKKLSQLLQKEWEKIS